MRKLLLLFVALLTGVSGAWAETALVSGYGDPLTLTQFKALAGTTGRFAFVASSNTAADNAPRCDHWCGFTSTHNTTTLSEDYLFYLEASGDNYKVKRASDNKYVSTSTESTSFVETGGFEFALVNRDPTDATKAVTGEKSIRFKNPSAENWYNANAVKLNDGLGAWTTFAVFGPIYIVTVNCVDESDTPLRTVKYIVTDGTTFTTAPNVGGYKAKANPNVTVSGADAVVKVTYEDAFQPSATKGYKLKMKGTDLYVKFRISGYTETNVVNATALSSEGSIFKLSTNEEGYTLKWQNEYLKTASTTSYSVWNTGHGTDTANSTWYIEAVDGEDDTYYLKKTSDASGSIFFGNDTETPAVDQYLYTNQSTSKRNIKWVLEETTMNERMVEQGYWPETSTSSSPKYYTIKNTRAGKYAKYAGDATMMELKTDRFESTANAFWFEAVSVDGLADDVKAVKIHNAGAGKCVAAPNSFTAAGITWYLKSDVDTTHGISVAINSSSTDWSNTGYGWNNYQGKGNYISTWESTDEGSGWWIDPLSDPEWNTISTLRPFIASPGDDYFKISSSDADALASGISTKGADGTITSAEYDELLENFNIKMPETGCYRIKSSGSRTAGETYITYGYCSDKSKYGLVTTPVANKFTDMGTVFKFTKVDTGVYKLSTQGLNVQDENGYDTPFTATSAEGVTFVIEILSPGVVAIRHNTSDDYAYLHESGWASPSGVVRWERGSDASQWTLEDASSVTIPLNNVGSESYGTVYLPFGVTLGDGADAYFITIENGRAKANILSEKEIPAGTPVLLRSTTNASSVTATINDAVTATTTGNKLVGTYTQLTSLPDGNNYILGNGDLGIGFYKLASGKVVGANKAYLNTDGVEVKSFALVFDEDGISSLSSVPTNNTIYDMSGRRVQNPARGLYIVNGKKVIVK